MINFDYGLASSRTFKLKKTLSRPHSHHRPSSISYQDRIQCRERAKGAKHRESMPITSANQYYIREEKQSGNRRPFKEFYKGNQWGEKNQRKYFQNMEKIKHFFIEKIQQLTSTLKEQISKQSIQIMNLEKSINKQNKEIQQKNNLIKYLSQKIKINNFNSKQTMEFKRMRDLQTKLKVIMEQVQEEKQVFNGKLELLTERIIKFYGKNMWKMKGELFKFIKGTDVRIERVGNRVDVMGVDLELKLMSFEKSIEKMQAGVNMFLDDNFSKDQSRTNNSKDTLSLGSQRSNRFSPCKDENLLFIAGIGDNRSQCIRVVQQLTRCRQELPIRVFVDNQGRLKYWQSRTFMFDRRGNFTTPIPQEILAMQQCGWLKLIND